MDMFPSYKDARSKRVERFNFDERVREKIMERTRCFILGMGPSLAKVDPESLKDEFVIGTNFIMRTEFPSDVICAVDNRRFDYENWSKSQIKVVMVKQLAFRRESQISQVNAYSDIDYVDYDNGLKRNVMKINDFNETFSEVNFSGSVITDLAVPFASYLGFKEIYVLGLDGAVASFPSTHVTGNEANYHVAHTSKLFAMHQKVGLIARQRGVKVFNASPGGAVVALDKISLETVKPTAVRQQFDEQADGKFIVFDGKILSVVGANGAYRLLDEASGKFVRHKNSKIFLEKDDGSELFGRDSSFVLEPSFVNKEWVCFRSVNLKARYITAADELGGYKMRSMDDVFSPYFSSYRLYGSKSRASQRVSNEKMLRSLSNLKNSLGDNMLADDKLN